MAKCIVIYSSNRILITEQTIHLTAQMNFKTIIKFLGEKRSNTKVYILYGSLSMKSQKGKTVIIGGRSVVASGQRRRGATEKQHDGCPLTGWQKWCWVLILLEIHTTAHKWQN